MNGGILMKRENAKRKGLNRLLVLVLAAAVTMVFSFTSISFAAEETGGSDQPITLKLQYSYSGERDGQSIDEVMISPGSTQNDATRLENAASVNEGSSFTEGEKKYEYSGLTWSDNSDLQFPLSYDAIKEKVNETKSNVILVHFTEKQFYKYKFQTIDKIGGSGISWEEETPANTIMYMHTMQKPELKEHYKFKYWKVGEVNYTGGSTYVKLFKEIQEDTTDTAYAWWQPALWFEYYDGDKLLKTTDDYYKDTAISSYEPEKKDGMKFIGWADTDGNLYAEGQIFKVPEITKDNGNVGPVKLYAQWKKNSAPYVPVTPSTPTEEHTVTFHPNNGESNFTQTVPDGGKAVQPEDPAQEGYTFDGWFTDSSFTQKYDFNTPVKGNIDLYAKWNKVVKPVNPLKPVKPSKKITGILLPKVIAKGKHTQTLTWTALTNVDGYFIYTNHCDEAQGRIPHPFKKVADYKATKARVYTVKNLKTYHNYKYYVAAYKIKNGKKVVVRNSVTVHSVCGNTSTRSTNVKSVKVSKHSVTLKKGQTYKVKATISKLNKRRAFLDATHCGLLRCLTADSKIATVNYKTGVIKAKKAGKTTVYVLGVNGIRDEVVVNVK